MLANLYRRGFPGLLLAALVAVLLTGMPLGAWAAPGIAMTPDDLVSVANQSIATVTLAEAKAMLGKPGVVFLDVREPAEVAKGRIPGAVTIPRGVLEWMVTEAIPNKDAKVIVYCSAGGRGALAAETLTKMGYGGATNLNGGYDAWTAAGNPSN